MTCARVGCSWLACIQLPWLGMMKEWLIFVAILQTQIWPLLACESLSLVTRDEYAYTSWYHFYLTCGSVGCSWFAWIQSQWDARDNVRVMHFRRCTVDTVLICVWHVHLYLLWEEMNMHILHTLSRLWHIEAWNGVGLHGFMHIEKIKMMAWWWIFVAILQTQYRSVLACESLSLVTRDEYS